MAKRVPPLSAMAVARLKPDPRKTIELVDGAVPGLRLRITPAGTRTWSLNMRARGVMRRFDVGSGLGLSEARQRAELLRRQVADGGDPTADRKQSRLRAMSAKRGIGTLGAVVQEYFESGTGATLKTKEEQLKRIKSVFSDEWGRPAHEVTSAQLQLAIDRHPAKVAAARAGAYLSPPIRWALKRGHMQGVFDLEKPVLPPPTQRVLSHDELAKLLPVFDDAYGRCCRFMLLTGARQNEARSATWEQFDLEGGTWTIPAQLRKDTREVRRRHSGKADMVIPLSGQAVELLREARNAEETRRELSEAPEPIGGSDLVFVGEQGGRLANWDRWLKISARKTGISNWSAHALRRTTATFAGELGAPPHIVSVILGHTNIGGQLVAGYNKSRYLTEHAQVLQAVADRLDAIRGDEQAHQPSSNVISICRSP